MSKKVLVDVPRLLTALGVSDWSDRSSDIWAPCPFPGHDENEASWHIIDDEYSDKHGHNYCFGCRRGGDARYLVAERIGLSSNSAGHRWIEERGLTIDAPVATDVRLVIRKKYSVQSIGLPAGAKIAPFHDWPTPFQRYAESRGITPRQAERWGLAYGRFGDIAQRLIFPARDSHGVIKSWTARTIGNAVPRYRSASKSEGYDPSAIFGEEHWPERKVGEILVVTEGAINALACERVGARNIAALSGSDLDPGQLLKMAKFDFIVLAFDPDQAGDKISSKVRAALARWKKVGIVLLPPRLDPRDVEASDPQMLRDALWDAMPLTAVSSKARPKRTGAK